jgi:rhodanese-related sulfurtransferase
MKVGFLQIPAAGGSLKSAETWMALGRQALVIVLLALALAWLVNHSRPSPLSWSWRPPPPSAPLMTDLGAFRQALAAPETVLVDARPALFYKMGHIPGAVSLPADETDAAALAAWRAGLTSDAVIIVYCTDDLCHLADQLAQQLLALGLAPAIFAPGFAGWEAAGLPVVSEIKSAGGETP